MFSKRIDKLTDNYNKSPNSNISKLFSIIADEMEELNKAMIEVNIFRDVDKAVGLTLDKIGRNVHQLRIDEDDELYRLLVKTKIIANLSKGDIETINQVANVLLGNGFVGVRETWNDPDYNNEPAGLVLTIKNTADVLPFAALDRVLAGGVGVRWVLEYKPDDNYIYIGSVVISGEEVTIYPYSISDLEQKSKVYMALGHNTSIEEITVYPNKE